MDFEAIRNDFKEKQIKPVEYIHVLARSDEAEAFLKQVISAKSGSEMAFYAVVLGQAGVAAMRGINIYDEPTEEHAAKAKTIFKVNIDDLFNDYDRIEALDVPATRDQVIEAFDETVDFAFEYCRDHFGNYNKIPKHYEEYVSKVAVKHLYDTVQGQAVPA